MLEGDLETSVTDWAIDHPGALDVFQELGIDYSCGGKSLESACRERDLDVRWVLARLLRRIEASRSTGREPPLTKEIQ